MIAAMLSTPAVAAAVAAHAVIQIADALIAMFAQNVLHRVLMAAVAGVAAVVVVNVARYALHVVVPVQHKGLFVIEAGRLPRALRVTLAAVASDLAVQFVGRCPVTVLALLAHGAA